MPEHQHKHSAWPWVLGGSAAALVAAPYVLPLVGVGSYNTTHQLLSICGSAGGQGLAATASHALASIPGVGGFLTSATGSLISSGVIGLGGVLLGRYIENKYDTPGQFPWGKAIRYAALATSILIALPSILSSISVGIGFLAAVAGGAALASTVFGHAAATVGLAPGMTVGSMGAGMSGLLPHLFTCGAASLPVIGSLFVGDKPAAQKSWTTRIETTTAPQTHTMAM